MTSAPALRTTVDFPYDAFGYLRPYPPTEVTDHTNLSNTIAIDSPPVKPNNTTYIFVDIETTGLDPQKHGICSVGAYATGENENDFRGFFYNECDPRYGEDPVEVDESAMKINGIDLNHTVLTTGYVLQKFYTFVNQFNKVDNFNRPPETILVFHNAKFDVAFLERFFRVYNIATKTFRPVLCTVSLGFAATGEVLSLPKLCARYDITNGQEHNALADAITTSKVFHAIQRDYKKPVQFQPYYQQLNGLMQDTDKTKILYGDGSITTPSISGQTSGGEKVWDFVH
jgi:DNA polymerase III epsilon subunit-like protein